MVKIKICGVKSMKDIEYVNLLNPDYIGFVFTKSKRQVTVDQVLEMKRFLNKDIKTVGVFLDDEKGRVLQIAENTGLNIVQLHGTEDLAYINYLNSYGKFEIWKAIGIKFEDDIKKIEQYSKYKIVLDGAKAGEGKQFSWDSIEEEILTEDFRKNLVLAGGLNFNNVIEGIKRFKPFAVDVSSGVETEGKKDYTKMKEFIERVRQYDKR